MSLIRPATPADLTRIAEIEIFNYRLFFYPIFRNDDFYFSELQVPSLAGIYKDDLPSFYVYDDGVVKGFIRIAGDEVRKLFVEPVLHGQRIGSALLDFAVRCCGASTLWVLEKNPRAIRFYERHGFRLTGERKPEDDTDEFLLRMTR